MVVGARETCWCWFSNPIPRLVFLYCSVQDSWWLSRVCLAPTTKTCRYRRVYKCAYFCLFLLIFSYSNGFLAALFVFRRIRKPCLSAMTPSTLCCRWQLELCRLSRWDGNLCSVFESWNAELMPQVCLFSSCCRSTLARWKRLSVLTCWPLTWPTILWGRAWVLLNYFKMFFYLILEPETPIET